LGVADHKRDETIAADCAVLTVSDTRTVDTDGSGALIRERLESRGHRVVAYEIVPDEPELVSGKVSDWVARDLDLVILNGGTGIAPRDNTVEAVSALFCRRLDGFGELFRSLSFVEVGAAAMLSRAVAGIAGTSAVFCLPGSTSACALAMDRLILPEIGHMVSLLRPRGEA
jgi:molybdenum cofactor biosynthesis protein B